MKAASDEHLQEVSEVYLRAVRDGLFPTKAVAEALGMSRSAAAGRVHSARRVGLLPETTPGRKMTPLHRAVKARTGSTGRFLKVLVCEECLIPWPCAESGHNAEHQCG